MREGRNEESHSVIMFKHSGPFFYYRFLIYSYITIKFLFDWRLYPEYILKQLFISSFCTLNFFYCPVVYILEQLHSHTLLKSRPISQF